MPRSDTLREPRWRVQVFSPLGEVTHESAFKSLDRAEEYYATLAIAKSVKRLDVRDPGASRFKLLKRETMAAPTPLMIECDECQGCGQIQATCATCNVALTEENVEPGADDLCAKCAKEES